MNEYSDMSRSFFTSLRISKSVGAIPMDSLIYVDSSSSVVSRWIREIQTAFSGFVRAFCFGLSGEIGLPIVLVDVPIFTGLFDFGVCNGLDDFGVPFSVTVLIPFLTLRL